MSEFGTDFLVSHVHRSIDKACRNESKLSTDVLGMSGMTGRQTRHLYNNICSVDGIAYLEVGVHKGSSYISALYENHVRAAAIDNWSEFGNAKADFFDNFKRFCPTSSPNVIEADCFQVQCADLLKYIPGIDVYLYDGQHTYESQRHAMSLFRDLYSKCVVIVVDDWRYDFVQSGTRDGIAAARLDIIDFSEKLTHESGTGPSEFWNGFGIFVCEKREG